MSLKSTYAQKIVEVTIPLSQHQPRVQDMSFETVVTFKSLPRICRDTRSKGWCTKRKQACGTNRWRAQQQCMATCGICTDGEPGKSGFFIMLPFVLLSKYVKVSLKCR